MSEPAPTAERRVSMEDQLARMPRLDKAVRVSDGASPDYDALQVLSTILSGGRSARFYEDIVRQKQLATNVNAFVGETRGPGLFQISATPTPSTALPDLEAAIDAELERIKSGTITNDELEKARASAQRQFVSTMGSSLGRAVNLSQSAVFYNDPGRFAMEPERIAKVTAADVQRVAAKYFTPANRTVVVTTPKGVRP
jgi:predicted Zn-dependent peptidase